MVHIKQVEEQLKAIGCNFRFFGRPEIKELTKILLPGETIAQCTNGYYEGGIALLVVTDHRLLLIDRKPMFLTIEDLRFDMISEIDFNHRLLNATARIFSTNKSLVFSSWNHARLRTLTEYLQHQVVQLRHQQHMMTQEQYMAMLPYVGQPALPIAAGQQPVQQQQPTQAQTYAPPALAQVALQGTSSNGIGMPQLTVSRPSTNPYTRIPLITKHRKFPRFN